MASFHFLFLSFFCFVLSQPIWPAPESMTVGDEFEAFLSNDFEFSCTHECPDILKRAFNRYKKHIFFAGRPQHSPSDLKKIEFSINNSSAHLELGVDESYSLVVNTPFASVTAETQWGALRALESFSQLVQWNKQSCNPQYFIQSLPIQITDKPRFPWRGVLIDSSRHFLTIDAIKITLEAMSFNKLNTLHWHIVDDNSWPLVSEIYPDLAGKGSYSPESVYTAQDVAEIVNYAHDRGIRVMPEWDMPGHATIWGSGIEDIVLSCPGGQPLLDPTGKLYDVLLDLWSEFDSSFSDQYVHLGGDEVFSYKCWEEADHVQKFMRENGLEDVNELRNYFQIRVQNLTHSLGKTAIFWQEVFDINTTLVHNSIVNAWYSNVVKEVVRKGHRVIQSYGWYLDQQTPPGEKHYFWVDTWKNFYKNDPVQEDLTPEEEALVLGGEASQWGEQVDETNIESRMWPRTAATAERLWSPKSVDDVDKAKPRLENQRCNMVRRGIRAGPVGSANEVGHCHIPKKSCRLSHLSLGV